jgi:hypothetical protein
MHGTSSRVQTALWAFLLPYSSPHLSHFLPLCQRLFFKKKKGFTLQEDCRRGYLTAFWEEADLLDPETKVVASRNVRTCAATLEVDWRS